MLKRKFFLTAIFLGFLIVSPFSTLASVITVTGTKCSYFGGSVVNNDPSTGWVKLTNSGTTTARVQYRIPRYDTIPETMPRVPFTLTIAYKSTVGLFITNGAEVSVYNFTTSSFDSQGRLTKETNGSEITWNQSFSTDYVSSDGYMAVQVATGSGNTTSIHSVSIQWPPPPPHTVTKPNKPSGPTTLVVGQEGTYTTGDSACNQGHSVTYQLDWGDGNAGGTEGKASHSWGSQDTYNVKAIAHCSFDYNVASPYSDALSVTVGPHVVLVPNTPSGSSSGKIGQSLNFSTGGSTCSGSGHTVEYRFDWNANGGHDYSSWGSANRSNSWSGDGTYYVKAQARCTSDNSVVSSWSGQKQVIISTTGYLQVEVRNIDKNGDGQPDLQPGVRVELYKSDGTDMNADLPTGSDGRTSTWTLPVGSYYIKVYYLSPTTSLEYWGKMDCGVTQQTGDDLIYFVRNMPYIKSIQFYDRSTANSVSGWGKESKNFAKGGRIFFKVTIVNLSVLDLLDLAKTPLKLGIRIQNFGTINCYFSATPQLTEGNDYVYFVSWDIDNNLNFGTWQATPILYTGLTNTEITDSWDFNPNRVFNLVNKTPVILVHGLGGDSSSFGKLEGLLEEDGFAVESFYYSTADVPGERTVQDFAMELASFVAPYSKIELLLHIDWEGW